MSKIILLLILITSFLFGRINLALAQEGAGGLRFYSQDQEFTKRTSFTLFDGYKTVTDSFRLDFDFKIYDLQRFGYIFRIIDEAHANSETPLCHFLSHPEFSEGHNTLFFIQNNKKSGKILIQKDDKKWIPFSLKIDCRTQSATIACNDSVFTFPIDLPKKLELNVIFGLLLRNNAEVAAFDIRNVRLKISQKQNYFWPLNEFSGDVAHEIKQGEESDVKNPNWLIKQHFFWNKIYECKADMMCGVEFDPSGQNIVLVNKDSLIYFNVQRNEVVSEKYDKERPFAKDAHFSIINPKSGELISYDFHFLKADGQKGYSVYEPGKQSWTLPDIPADQEENHFHVMFWNNDTTRLIKFGGYAHYKFFNDFRTFDFKTNTWEALSLAGDEIYPRSNPAIGKNYRNQHYYLFGGLGNKEGEQVLGVQNFYDLYSLDFKNLKSRKIWELDNKSLVFLPRSQMIVEPGDSSCYILCSQSDKQNAALSLYKFSLIRPQYEIVSDSLPANFYNLSGNPFLFMNKSTNELYCVLRQTFINKSESQISIYKINYPPAQLSGQRFSSNRHILLRLIIGLIVLITGFVVLWYFRMQQSVKRKPDDLKQESNTNNIVSEKKAELTENSTGVLLPENHPEAGESAEQSKEYIRPKTNALWLLGKFTIFDRKGRNITHLCSSKIKSLFFLIFLSSFYDDGISSDELSDILWPGMDKTRTKNNRSVTMNHLRKIFEDMDGISLVHEARNWKIIFNETVYIDLIDLYEKRKDIGSNLAGIIGLYSIGNLLMDEKIPELDKYKGDFEAETIETLTILGQDFFGRRKYSNCIEVANILHQYYDELNENALYLKLNALTKLRNYNKARQEYDNFCQRFKLIMGSEFTVSFGKLTEGID